MQQNWISLGGGIGIYNSTQMSPYAANGHKDFEAKAPHETDKQVPPIPKLLSHRPKEILSRHSNSCLS